jgi:hypothetical protein
MGVDWEGYGPFSHADSPDRYILLSLSQDRVVTNVSADYPGFYMSKVAYAEERFLQHLASLNSYEGEMTDLLPVWKDNTYMSYAVTILIRYHDMGKHDEGVRLARDVIKLRHFSNCERYQYARALIDETIADLEMQDRLIEEAIDDYNAGQRTIHW